MLNPFQSPGNRESKGTTSFHTSYPFFLTTYKANAGSLPSLWFLVLELNQTQLHNFSTLTTKQNLNLLPTYL